MKVKESSNISNKKKNALPSSKLLKPKKFKPSLKKSGESKKPPLSKDKLKLVNENINNLDLQCGDNIELTVQRKPSTKIKTLKNSLGLKEKTASYSSSPKKSKSTKKESKTKTLSTLFDFVTSQEQKVKHDDKISAENKRVMMKRSFEKNQSSKTVDKDQNKENETTASDKQNLKASKTPITQEKKKKEKVIAGGLEKSLVRQEKTKKSSENKQLLKVVEDQNKGNDLTAINKCNLKASKVAVVTKGLLKLIDESSSSKPEILDVGEPVFLQVECVKIPICPTKQLRFKLPHPLVDETSDVLLITADLKGHKIYPDKAVEHYEELLAKHEIKSINKVMPLRMVKKEYSQYEMKRKLIDQFDVILADSRIIKSLPAVLGKFALYKRKMPVPVNLTIGEHKLKKHLGDAMCKTQMTVKSNGHCSVVQIGHSKMSAKEIAANLVEVAKSLEALYPGGWRNVRCLGVKTAKSTSLPVYLSLLSPNEVKIPVEVRRRPKPVEGELSTMPGYNVVVTADGNVVLKKVEEDLKIDNSRDDEILEEAQKYLESSKTVRYDESSDEEKNEEEENGDSDDEGEAITEVMEKKLMNKYEKKAKTKKNKKEEDEDEDEEEEEEEESEEESEVVPVTGKKRKSQGSKKQSGPVAKKAFSAVEPKGKNKVEKAGKEKDNKTTASPGFKKQQTRGTRGGKKNKLSKDQRKALIKRKKAGKK